MKIHTSYHSKVDFKVKLRLNEREMLLLKFLLDHPNTVGESLYGNKEHTVDAQQETIKLLIDLNTAFDEVMP